MSPSTIYLISGANRGIGYGLVSHILEKHQHAFVYAGARNPAKAKALNALNERYPGRLSVVKSVSGDVEGHAALAKVIEETHGRVDTVIANAGISLPTPSTAEVDPKVFESYFHVNVTGTLVLFQATYAFLKKSSNPRFVSVSSPAGCLDGMVVTIPAGGVSYGASKAALNWVTRKIHFENDWLVAFPLSPGVVETDGLKDAMVVETTGIFKQYFDSITIPTVEEAAVYITKIVDESTREKDGGQFVNIDGTRLPW